MSEIKISLFKPSKNGKPGAGKPIATDFYTEMGKIKDGTHWPVIKKLRQLTDPLEKRNFKVANLPGFTVSALCEKHRENKGAQHSGLLAIDIDPKENTSVTDWPFVRDMLFEMPDVVASFLSASGNGVAVIYKVDPKKHKDVFYSIKDEYSDNFDLVIDAGCHDVVRLRFASYDDQAKIRHAFDEIPTKEPSLVYLEKKAAKENAKVPEYTGEVGNANCDRAFNFAIKSAEKKIGQFGDGVKHSFLVSLAGFANTIGMDIDYLKGRVYDKYGTSTDIGQERLFKPLENVYRTYKHKHNTYVQTVKARRLNNQIVGHIITNFVHKGIKPTKDDLAVIAEDLEANIDRVEAVAERVVDEYSEEHNMEAKAENVGYKAFWYVDEDDKVCISKMGFRDFLIKNGVWRFRLEKKWILIQIIDNIVDEIQKDDVKRIVFDYVEKMREPEVWEVLANRVSSVFADDYLEIIPLKWINFFRDTRDTITLFYRNGIIRITKEESLFIQWTMFEGIIWRSQVLDRDIKLTPKPGASDFNKFIRNITKKDTERYKSVATAIGYMLHSYKDPSNAPAVILNDEVISDTPEGGTGKGLIVQALMRFKKVCRFDGKTFEFEKSFVYQRVTMDTQIMFFDDVKKTFSFEKLFSVMTEGLTVEKKGSPEFMIPFINSPKVIISTNYAIGGEGNSQERRRHELELSQYYTKTFTPKDEFKHLMFDDWNEEQFNDFDNLIFRFCNLYLQVGLLAQIMINQPLKKLLAVTSQEFVDFMDEDYPHDAQAYRFDQAQAYANYQRLYPSKLGAKTFYAFMVEYYKFHNTMLIRAKSGDVRYFCINGG